MMNIDANESEANQLGSCSFSNENKENENLIRSSSAVPILPAH